MSAKCQKRTLGCRLSLATLAASLNWRARYRSIRAKHAAVSGLGPQNLAATFAGIETDAGVRGHYLGL